MEAPEQTGRRIKLPHLSALVAVAQTGSMAKAAKRLSTSQSVVSKAIAELERTLGVQLFDRTSQGVEPTLYGTAMVRRSIAILDEVITSVSEVRFLADPTAGELRLGTTEPQSGLVADVVTRLARQYQGTVYTIVTSDGATLIGRDLMERRVELIVAPIPKRGLDDRFEAIFLYDNWLRLVVSKTNRWARRANISLEDLANDSWCAPLDGPAGPLIVDAFRAKGMRMPPTVLTALSTQLITKMVIDGPYVGILSDGVVHFSTNRSSLKVLPIEFSLQPLPIAIISLKNRTISPVAKLFVDCAREVSRHLPKKR